MRGQAAILLVAKHSLRSYCSLGYGQAQWEVGGVGHTTVSTMVKHCGTSYFSLKNGQTLWDLVLHVPKFPV